MESRYLGILQKLQESEELNPELREAIKKVLKDAVQADLNAAIKINPIRYTQSHQFTCSYLLWSSQFSFTLGIVNHSRHGWLYKINDSY